MMDGQTVKTKIVAEALEAKLGEENVNKIDTHGNAVQILKSVVQAVVSMFCHENMMMLPAHNGVRVFGLVLALVKNFSRCKLHYVVIGGWLPKILKGNRLLANALKKFDAIYVETSTMQKQLEEQGFSNIVLMPNCKKLRILSSNETVSHTEAPYPLCTFSRVMEEKGIEKAIEAVKTINEQKKQVVYTLDIYGPVDPGYQERFSKLQKEFPAYVRYCGSVPQEKSVPVVKRYAALLFPTRFYTEGVPGTIIDAYAAGVPVIASRWESFADVVDDGLTGIGYPFEIPEKLLEILRTVAENPQILIDMKSACLKKAEDFSPAVIDKILLPRL